MRKVILNTLILKGRNYRSSYPSVKQIAKTRQNKTKNPTSESKHAKRSLVGHTVSGPQSRTQPRTRTHTPLYTVLYSQRVAETTTYMHTHTPL